MKKVYVFWAAGGGTGSGASSTVLEILRENDNRCYCVMVLPSEKMDGGTTWQNAANSLVALNHHTDSKAADRVGVLVVPNDHLFERVSHQPEDNETIYEKMNKVLGQIFKTFYFFEDHITDVIRAHYVLDRNEYRTLRTARGLYGYRIEEVPDINNPPQTVLEVGGPSLTVGRLKDAAHIIIAVALPRNYFKNNNSVKAGERLLEKVLTAVTQKPGRGKGGGLEKRRILSGIVESLDHTVKIYYLAAGCDPNSIYSELRQKVILTHGYHKRRNTTIDTSRTHKDRKTKEETTDAELLGDEISETE
jgi:hypothetical protein